MRKVSDAAKSLFRHLKRLSPFDRFCLIACAFYVVMIVGAALFYCTHTSYAPAAPVLPTPRDYQVYKLVYTEEEYGHTRY